MPRLERYLDGRNVATRKGMGRDYAIRLVKKYLEHFKRVGRCYVLKMDIAKYFYRIDHEVLKGMLEDRLTDEEYSVISSVIGSTDESYINETIRRLKEEELVRVKNGSRKSRIYLLTREVKDCQSGICRANFYPFFS